MLMKTHTLNRYLLCDFSKKIFPTLLEMPISYIGASQVVLVVKNPPANAGDEGSIPESGRSPGGWHGNPLQNSSLEDPRGQRSLMGYSPQGHKELDTTEPTQHISYLEGKRRRRRERMRWLDSITDSRDMNLSKLRETVEDGGAGVLQSMWSQRVGHNLAAEQ